MQKQTAGALLRQRLRTDTVKLRRVKGGCAVGKSLGWGFGGQGFKLRIIILR